MTASVSPENLCTIALSGPIFLLVSVLGLLPLVAPRYLLVVCLVMEACCQFGQPVDFMVAANVLFLLLGVFGCAGLVSRDPLY